jgi:hypothetical protein
MFFLDWLPIALHHSRYELFIVLQTFIFCFWGDNSQNPIRAVFGLRIGFIQFIQHPKLSTNK